MVMAKLSAATQLIWRNHMTTLTKRLLLLFAALALFGAACSSDDDDAETGEETEESESGEESAASAEGKLADVLAEGSFKCGTRTDLPGFASTDADGNRTGFDVDFCRAIAAGLFGDSEAVEFVDLETADRFTALQNGEIDVLVRNTTWTASRDGGEQANFLTVTFYDGQGMAVPADSSAASLADLGDGSRICVAAGTTTEANAADKAAELGVDWDIATFDDADSLVADFAAGNCDGWSADKSGLVSNATKLENAPTIFEDTFSREPLAPAVLDGDTGLAQAVNWVINATIYGEELGLDSSNVGSADTSDAVIGSFLGVTTDDDGNEIEFDAGLGLSPDFAKNVIEQVGNYGEIFEDNLAPLGLERAGSLNDLAINGEGGVHYGIPQR